MSKAELGRGHDSDLKEPLALGSWSIRRPTSPGISNNVSSLTVPLILKRVLHTHIYIYIYNIPMWGLQYTARDGP